MNVIMKTMKYFWLLCLAILPFSLIACSDDDDEGSTPMTIDKIFLEDAKSTVPDREVDFARLGQMLRIQGSGFSGLKAIYVNGYKTQFNTTMVTDNNIWVTLSGKTPVETAETDVRNTIRLVKSGTELVHNFTIRAAAPSITSVSLTMPKPGETVVVRGSNLQEVVKVILPGGVELTNGITNAPEEESGEWFSFVMPEGVTASGSITAEGANGTAISAAYFNNADCFIIDFDGLGNLGSWGQTYSADDLVDDPLNSGRGKVLQLIPQSVLDEGGIAAGARTLLWATAGNDDPVDNWARMTQFIPESTPASEVAIQFEICVPDEWNETGMLEISLQNNLSTYGYGSADTQPSSEYLHQAGVWVPWLNSDNSTTPFTTGTHWQTVTLPLTTFGNYTEADDAHTFQNVIDDRNAGSYRNFLIFFVNNDVKISDDLVYEAKPSSQLIYIDNLRIVPIKAPTVSDFNDDATEE